MRARGLRRGLLGSAAAVAIMHAAPAMAGGFINQSQSTVYNGMAYAGYAAPGYSPSGMFLNPAVMSFFNRVTTENNFSFVIPNTRITGASGLIPAAAGGTIPSGDIALDAFVPASYIIIPLGNGFTIGASLNAPFGSATKPDMPWGGQLNSLTTVAKTYNLTPAIAYQVTPEFSIGLGVQFQFMYARFMTAGGAGPNPPVVGVEGDGMGYGITAGLAWTPLPGTAIGLGYRSRIDQKLEGNFLGFPLPAFLTPIRTTVKLPDRLNLSLRQSLSSSFDLLASIEWHNWSRIGVSTLRGPGVALVPAAARALPFNYQDAWFFALGGEYRWNQDLTLRAGLAYEISPVTTAVRTTRLPDNDRFWLSAGLTYQVTDRIALNLSYSHVFVKEAPIAIAPPAGAPYVGVARASSDILSIGFTTKWGSAPEGVLRQAAVVRK